MYFLTLAAGAIVAVPALVKMGRRALADPRVVGLVLVGIAAFGPYAYAAVRGTVVYDGLRHALFTIPLLASLCGCAFDALLADRRHRLLCLVVGLGGVLSLLVTVRDMVELHPYETVFFNRAIAGGLSEAGNRYETDYWGNSYREGAEWVARHYREAPGRRASAWAAALRRSRSSTTCRRTGSSTWEATPSGPSTTGRRSSSRPPDGHATGGSRVAWSMWWLARAFRSSSSRNGFPRRHRPAADADTRAAAPRSAAVGPTGYVR